VYGGEDERKMSGRIAMLERRKIYVALPDAQAEELGKLDYLYSHAMSSRLRGDV
jgi:hypothetical protein